VGEESWLPCVPVTQQLKLTLKLSVNWYGCRCLYVMTERYTSPHSTAPSASAEPLEQLNQVLKYMSKKTKNPNATIILAGDFNCKDIDWDTNTITVDCDNKQLHEHLLDILSDHHLTQMQREPTRFGNTLDLYCANKPGLVKYITTNPGISDHDTIVVDALLRPEYVKKKSRRIYLYNKADWEAMKTGINTFTSEYLASLEDHSVDENWVSFKQNLQELVDQHVPSRQSRSRQHLPWITPAIRRMSKKKQRLYNKSQED